MSCRDDFDAGSTSPVVCDEETALLSSSPRVKDKKKPTPLPKVQLSILMMVQLIEPVASQSIYPFINQLVWELDITGGDEKKVGYYAGLIESLFFATQAITVLQWSRVSDRIGRKPVLLIGVFGLTLSMLCFGLSRTFWTLVLSRCITGALNGNIGVMKSMMGELTDSTNMAQGFSLMPIAWSLGVTLGPTIGGLLARPQDNFPRLFGGPFWAAYPYFLPCAAAAMCSAITFVCILLFLKETLPRRSSNPAKSKSATAHHIPATANSDSDYLPPDPASILILTPTSCSDDPVALRSLLIPSILIPVFNYGTIATFEIAMMALIPLFLSTPIPLGGLGFSPSAIGLTMAIFGIINGPMQALFLAPLVDRFGAKRMFEVGVASYIPIFGLFPFISLVAKWQGISALVWVLVVTQLSLAVFQDMAFSCILMFVTASAPNRRSLGATNGLAQTTGSISRTLGPAMSTSMFAYSIQHNLLGGYAVYVILVMLAALALVLASRLDEEAIKQE